MQINFESSFLTDLTRIDNKVLINKCVIGTKSYNPEVVYNEDTNVVHICLSGVDDEGMSQIEFYYGDDLKAFTITNEDPIVFNPDRTLFEFSFPEKPKAEIGCPWLTQDTEFLESPGVELGKSFYKNIEISDSSLIWKESIGKYVTDRGVSDDHSYDVERLDTKSGELVERPIKFRSYTNLVIDQGNWEIDTVTVTKTVKQDIYSKISASYFQVWNSPMEDSEIDYSKIPDCREAYDEYLDPGNLVFGNTDCFQYIKYSMEGQLLKGMRITGTPGSKVTVLFNREYSGGSFTEFECVVGKDGVGEVMFTDLPYYHLNGIITSGPSKIENIETIIYRDDVIEEEIPNPDSTYLVEINNIPGSIKIFGYCDYIEYEKYLGVIKEIKRGQQSIDSIPGIEIIELEKDPSFNSSIDNLSRSINYNTSNFTSQNFITSIYQVIIRNNIEVNGNILTTSRLESDYKIKIEQEGIVWKFSTLPDYKMEDDDLNIYLLKYPSGYSRTLKILTNIEDFDFGKLVVEMESEISEYFQYSLSYQGTTLVDGEYWKEIWLVLTTKSENGTGDWRPKNNLSNPIKTSLRYDGKVINSISFYAIQLRQIEPELEVWEETLPGKFTKVNGDSLTIYNSITKNFIIVKSGLGNGSWYYYDLTNMNKFYLTDSNSNVTNQGNIFNRVGSGDIIDLGTSESSPTRSRVERILNVNRSDLINNIGVLTITESAGYPGSWRDLLNTSTINLEVNRILNNIYILVGTSQDSVKAEDLELEVTKIGVYEITVLTNFKFVAEVEESGYLRFLDGSTLSTRKEFYTGYSGYHTLRLALTGLDDSGKIGNSVLEIRSGNVSRKVTVKVSDNFEVTHQMLNNNYDSSGYPTIKPNVIRISNNGALVTNNKLFYSSTTTPKIEYVDIDGTSEDTPIFKTNEYKAHRSNVTISVPNSQRLSYTKYPIKSFGSIKESSLSYSSEEGLPIEYFFYMKGKEHRIWYSENLYDFSNIDDSNVPTESNIYIDASGTSGKSVYIVSRYNDNRTFGITLPSRTEQKIVRNNLEAVLSMKDMSKLSSPDEITQIEYYIPIQVECNVENNGGNVYLGSFDFSATTRISEGSIPEVIDVSDEVIEAEGINASYIKNYILNDSTQNLKIRIFQRGTSDNVFNIYSDVSDFGVDADTKYVIPEVGNSIYITNVSCSLSPSGGSQCTVTPEFSRGFFLVKVDSKDRVGESEQHWYNYYMSSSTVTSLASNIDYTLTINATYNLGTKTFTSNFKRYGCNYGFVIQVGSVTWCGLGNAKSATSESIVRVNIPAKGGGPYVLHAGVSYLVNGVDYSQALLVPTEYEFIGEYKPLDVTWEDGNLDDSGNLLITFLPRTRYDSEEKHYLMRVSKPHEYYPMNLYVDFVQAPYTEDSYVINFERPTVNVLSDGTIEGDEKIKFSHNLNESTFKNLSFGWSGTIPNSPDNLETLETVDITQEGNSGYVRFDFKPNGSRTFLNATIYAYINGVAVGSFEVRQGYLSIETVSSNNGPTSYLSRMSTSPINAEYTPSRPVVPTPVYRGPCKANDDNSKQYYSYGAYSVSRTVFHLIIYKREYFDSSETQLNINNLNARIEKVGEFTSPSIFLNTGLNLSTVGPDFAEDHDAKVNYDLYGREYASSTNFAQYAPYIEVEYLVKEEYIRKFYLFTARGKLIIKPDYLEKEQVFLFSSSVFKDSSGEPEDISGFSLSSTNIKFGCEGGVTKHVAFTPAFKDLVSISTNCSWVSDVSLGDDVISVTAQSNTSTDYDKASYRSGEIILTMVDPRKTSLVLAKYVINLEQEPDSQSFEIKNIPAVDPGTNPSSIYITLTIDDRSGERVDFNGRVGLHLRKGGQSDGYFYVALPDYEKSKNNYTLYPYSILVDVPHSVTESDLNVYSESSSSSPESYIGGSIVEAAVYVSTTLGAETVMTRPYTLTNSEGGAATFTNGGSYKITITD